MYDKVFFEKGEFPVNNSVKESYSQEKMKGLSTKDKYFSLWKAFLLKRNCFKLFSSKGKIILCPTRKRFGFIQPLRTKTLFKGTPDQSEKCPRVSSNSR